MCESVVRDIVEENMRARGFPLSRQPSAGAPSQRHQLKQLPIYTLASVFQAAGRIKPDHLNTNPKSDSRLSGTRPRGGLWGRGPCEDEGWGLGARRGLKKRRRWRQDEGKEQTQQEWRSGCGWRSPAPPPPAPPRSTHNKRSPTGCGAQPSSCCCCPGCFPPQYVWAPQISPVNSTLQLHIGKF